MKLKLLNIVERVRKTKSIGIVYNIPLGDIEQLLNHLAKTNSVIIVKGKLTRRTKQFYWRHSNLLHLKQLYCYMLPAVRIILVEGTDIFKLCSGKVLEDCSNTVPILLLLTNTQTIREFRRLPLYHKVLTIEQDYLNL